MAANAGEIRARLVLSNDEFKRKMNESREEMKKTGFSAEQMNKDFSTIQKGFGILGGAVVATIGGSVKVAADFEQSMAKVQAISGSTAEEFKLQEEAAREMGAATIFSASEAAEGLSYLAMAGFDVDQQIGSLPAVLNAAIAGNMGLGQSAEIVTNIMSAFGLSADESGGAVDVLAKAANSANTDIPLMGEAFKMVAPVANALGWSIEETAAAIGELGNVGISGSQAGTVLRASLLALANPTGQTEKAMEDLNIQVINAEGNMKSLPELMGHIAERFEGMSDAQKTQAAAQLVGTQAAAGFIALLEVGEDGLQDFTTELENSAGTAQKMADIQSDTLVGSFKEFESAMEEAGIKLGKEFLPLFTDIVRFGADVVNTFDDVNAGQLKSALVFGGTAAAIALAITTIGKLVIAARTLMVSMGPAGWLITGLSLLGGLFAANALNSEDLGDKVERLSQEFNDLQSLDEKIDEFDRLQLNSKLTADEFARFIDINSEMERTTDPQKIADLREEQEQLYKNSGLSNDELDRMVVLNGELVEIMPSATDQISEQGNAIIGTTDALKEYSKERLESLYAELELTRLATEIEYKEVLKEEEQLIKEQHNAEEKLSELKDKKLDLQKDLNQEEVILADMLENKELYHETELQNQRYIVEEAKRLLELNEQDIADQATKIQGNKTELDQIREEIQDHEEIREQMIQILLTQEGLTAERGEGIQAVKDEIRKLEEQKHQLEKNTDEAHKNSDEYRAAQSEITENINRLRGVEQKINDITSSAESMNSVIGRPIWKDIQYRYTSTGSPGPHNREARPLAYHTGGIAGKTPINQIPKLHTGGFASDLMSRPLHNEIDVRLLRNEMVLTESQQANLMRMIASGSRDTIGTNNQDWSNVVQLLGRLVELTEEGKDYSIVMNDRVLGEMVEPHVTNQQLRKNNRRIKNNRRR